MITEVNSSGAWNRGEIYAGNRHVATYSNGNTYFDTTDWLGTAPMLFQTRRGPHRQDRAERVRADENGAVAETCESLPGACPERSRRGDELGCSGNDVSPLHFTGKQRDPETGLDYFGARYSASSLGRFMTPDWSAKVEPVPYAKLGDPQSLNLYAYVLDNPVSGADPNGHCSQDDPNCSLALGAPILLPTGKRARQIEIGVLELAAAYYTGGAAMAAGSALQGAFLAAGSAGLLVKGTSRILETAVGTNAVDANRGSEVITAVTSPVGLAVTLATGGNVKEGASASEVASVGGLAANPGEAAKNPAETALTLGRLAQDAKEAYSNLKALLGGRIQEGFRSAAACSGATGPNACPLPPPQSSNPPGPPRP